MPKDRHDLTSLESPTVYLCRRLSSHRDPRRALRMENAREAIGPLYPGCEIYGFTKGQFCLIHILEHCLEETGPAEVDIATWSAASGDIQAAYRLMRLDAIRRLRFVVDFSFQSRKPRFCEELLATFGEDALRVTKIHAKSTMSAPVGLWMLAADNEPGSEVYSAATTRDQAKIVWQIAKEMARRTPPFLARFGVQVNAHTLTVLSRAGKFEPLSAEANSLDGLNVHCAIVDELHAHKTREVFDVLETATGARRQPLLWCITTAGSNRAGICYEQRSYVTKILDGVVKDDTYFGVIYTIDDTDDWTDPLSWAKANPNYGVSVLEDDIARLASKAQQLASAQNAFLTKRLNVWVNADTAWMEMRAWDRCSNPKLEIEDWEGHPCWIGIDLASKLDLASMAILFRGADGKYRLLGRHYLPEETVEMAANSQYAGWAIEGRLITTPGNVIDCGRIEEDLMDLRRRFEIHAVAYDPNQATQFSTRMLEQGFPMVEIPPTTRNFSEPMKELEKVVVGRQLEHDGDPVLTWAVSNVVCHTNAKDEVYPRKERFENKIDPVVAAILAMGRALAGEAQRPEPRIRFVG